MNHFKSFFAFAILACSVSFFSLPAARAQAGSGDLKIQMHVEPLAAAYIKFDGIDGEVAVQEGRNIVGENTRTGEKLIVVVKGGKLTGFGTQAARGSFKLLTPSASPCFTITCGTFNPPKCFPLSNGACVCVCGPWITSSAGGN